MARDGIEPPTPAFSGPPTDKAKSSEMSAKWFIFLDLQHAALGLLRTLQEDL